MGLKIQTPMKIFYYCYSYQHGGKQELEVLFGFDEMRELPHDLQPVLAALKGAELDVDQRVLDEVMAYACQL
jgi:TRAP-type mannitol/chloroaromatic compound transport system substrate-binding protein